MGLFSNPANKALPYLQQIPGMVSGYFNPYIQAGMGALPQLQSQYGNLMSDPAAALNKIAEGYQKSPGYDFAMKQAQNAISHQQAAGGMAGSPQAALYGGQAATNLANEDFNNWMRNALGMYQSGLGGEQGLLTGGQNAAQNLAGLLGTNQMNMANWAGMGQQNQNSMWGSLLSNLMGGLGTALGGPLGGIFGLGGKS